MHPRDIVDFGTVHIVCVFVYLISYVIFATCNLLLFFSYRLCSVSCRMRHLYLVYNWSRFIVRFCV